jgi:hypothetical protein
LPGIRPILEGLIEAFKHPARVGPVRLRRNIGEVSEMRPDTEGRAEWRRSAPDVSGDRAHAAQAMAAFEQPGVSIVALSSPPGHGLCPSPA